MKLIRILTVAFAILVPTLAIAHSATSSADCCDGGACCHPGCPFCNHK